jgi:two-component system, LytTR family, response regulator LytT
MRILIIEDELPAARQLSKLILANNPEHQILDILDSVEGSVRWLRNFSAPDLIFMDIQIADGLSFDIFNQVKVAAPVVFTTAFDQYAVQAFRVNAINYLLKPIDAEELDRTFEKIRARDAHFLPIDVALLSQLLRPVQYKDRFLVKTGQHFSFIEIKDVAFFRSSGGLTQAYSFQNKKYFIDHSLEEMEQLTDPKIYFRISRHLTVHLKSIQKIHPFLNGRLKLELSPDPGEDVFVSRERVGEFKAWLGG